MPLQVRSSQEKDFKLNSSRKYNKIAAFEETLRQYNLGHEESHTASKPTLQPAKPKFMRATPSTSKKRV